MKKIMIATDFSPAARNATDYALRLAEAFDAPVVLMAAYEQEPILVTETPLMLNSEIEKDLVQRRLEQEVDNLMTEKPKAIDILVLRPEPKSLLGERLYGSTTRDMLFDSSIPLLILPPTHHE